MYLKKKLPLEQVMNRAIALAVSHRKTAANLLESAARFSSVKVVDELIAKYEARANEMELFALSIMDFQYGADSNHIFHYHTELSDDDERALKSTLKNEVEDSLTH